MRKYCYFFCYEGAVESKNVKKPKKSQDFGLETFFFKRSRMELVKELKTDN